MQQHEKLAELVIKLHARTKEGRLQWQEASLGTGYEASFPGYTVGIQEVEDYDDEIREAFMTPQLTIYNDEGKQVERVKPWELPSPEDEGRGRTNFHKLMGEIHELARRTALGADKAVDALLEALK